MPLAWRNGLVWTDQFQNPVKIVCNNVVRTQSWNSHSETRSGFEDRSCSNAVHVSVWLMEHLTCQKSVEISRRHGLLRQDSHWSCGMSCLTLSLQLGQWEAKVDHFKKFPPFPKTRTWVGLQCSFQQPSRKHTPLVWLMKGIPITRVQAIKDDPLLFKVKVPEHTVQPRADDDIRKWVQAWYRF